MNTDKTGERELIFTTEPRRRRERSEEVTEGRRLRWGIKGAELGDDLGGGDAALAEGAEGEGVVAFGEALDCGTAQCLPAALPRARAMLPLAAALWARGGAVDAALALPLYLRDKVAQTMAERAALKADAAPAALSSAPAAFGAAP